MTIALRQYQTVYNKHLLAILKDGKVPSLEEVLARAGDELPAVNQPVKPIYKYRPQAASSIFDIDYYNKAVANILADLKILFEELSDIEVNNIQRILHADIFNAVHNYELDKLNRQLDSLLFSLQGADDNFFASFDSFNDLSKTDSTKSTQSIVSLDEGCLALPIFSKGTLKIGLSHLYDTVNANLGVSRQDAKVIGNIPGTKLGNIFRDSLHSWGVILESESNGPLDVSFSFQLKLEENINRITVVTHSDKPQTLFIETSVDNVNIKSILDYSEGIVIDSQSNLTSLDFTDTLTEYVYVTLSKSEADTVTTNGDKSTYTYVFGLKNISLFTTGRANSATYYSKPIDFSDRLSSIGKVAISSDENIPDQTSIDWSVALLSDQEELVGSYIPIAPQSRSDQSGLPKVVSIQDTFDRSLYIVSTEDSYVNILNFYSIDFYSIATIDSEPIFGTAKLFRGYKSWFRDVIGVFDTAQVKDNFLPFSKAPSQYLYDVYQEVVTIKTIAGISNQRVLLASKPPLYVDSGGGYSLIPAKGLNTDKDTSPNYAIYKAILSSGSVAKAKTGVTFSSSFEDLGQPNIIYNAPSDILIQEVVVSNTGAYVVGQVIKQFVDGRDYIVELGTDGYTTGKIILTTGSALSAATTLGADSHFVIKYNTDPNVTRFITSVKNNQVIFTISAVASVLSDEQVIIRYRYVPTDIIKSSIKVKAFFGTAGNSKIYQQGTDFIFDSTIGAIQKLTTGTIGTTDVYVDYKFKQNISSIQQFFIWAFIPDSSGKDIKVKTLGSGLLNNQNTLTPDLQSGENFSANVPGLGLVDLTNATVWPKMSGWIQFIVKSISPESLMATTQTPLIKQVILQKDLNDQYIFVQGGKYFSELTAIREPLKQVSLPYLKTNVLKNDGSYFAIREQQQGTNKVYQVITNFQPNLGVDLYSYSVDIATGNIILNSEEWKLVWVSKEVTNPLTKVVVKATLNRSSSTDGNITPKVFGYYIKVSY